MHRTACFLYCPNESCPIQHTSPFQTLLIEEHFVGGAAARISPFEDAKYMLKCPFCATSVLQCENCYSLVMGDLVHDVYTTDEWKAVICRECGFLNVVAENIRDMLCLDCWYPMSESKVRRVQKCIIGEGAYISAKLCFYQSLLEHEQSKLQKPALETPPRPPNIQPDESIARDSPLQATPPEHTADIPTPAKKQKGKKNRKNKSKDLAAKQNKAPSKPNSNGSNNSDPTDDDPQVSPPLKKLKTEHVAGKSCSTSDLPQTTDVSSAHTLWLYRSIMDKISSPDLATADSLELEKMSFESCCHNFGASDLMMLQALYHDGQYEDLFSLVTLFIKEHADIISVKMQCESALKILERQKHCSSVTDDTPNVYSVVNSIFKGKYDRLRRLLSYYTKQFPQFLVLVNAELKKLYTTLIAAHNKSAGKGEDKAQPANQPPDWNEALGNYNTKYAQRELFLETKNKILLWRKLYKTVSICVL